MTRPALGFSIIELMVAITVSMILLAGVISIFVSNKQTYTITDNMSRLQENARFAMDFMSRDLRMTGYFGCADDVSTVTNSLYTAGQLWDTSNSLEVMASAWSPGGINPPVRSAGTDAFTVRYLMGQGSTITADTTTTQATLSAAGIDNLVTELGLSSSANLVNTLMGIADCKRGNIFQVSAVAGNTLSFDGANSRLSLGYAFDTISNTPAVYPLRAVRYYIGQNRTDAANNSLFRQEVQYPAAAADLTNTATANNELVESVEDMQILYGIDQDDNGIPEQYLNTAGITAIQWASVVTLRIGLLMRTTDAYGTDPDTNLYNLYTGQKGCVAGSTGCVDPADLNVRRRVFTTTVHLRN
ncbi:MAG: hypothetical protein GY731_10850 [Gammaproteobacteria bacterium]|nr:hypothetical protein [Gammaproteobacteria bacterium]